MLNHEQIEKSVPLLVVLTFLVILWGGLLEIVPLFFQSRRRRRLRVRSRTLRFNSPGVTYMFGKAVFYAIRR